MADDLKQTGQAEDTSINIMEMWRFLRTRQKLWLLPIVLLTSMTAGLSPRDRR
jgi:hypothetical protein